MGSATKTMSQIGTFPGSKSPFSKRSISWRPVAGRLKLAVRHVTSGVFPTMAEKPVVTEVELLDTLFKTTCRVLVEFLSLSFEQLIYFVMCAVGQKAMPR